MSPVSGPEIEDLMVSFESVHCFVIDYVLFVVHSGCLLVCDFLVFIETKCFSLINLSVL